MMEMVLLIHIAVALASVAYSGYAFARPSGSRIKVSYGLIGGTVATGALLVVAGASMVHACVSGLIFVSVATALTIFGQRRLAVEKQLN